MTLKNWNNGDVLYGSDMDSLVLNSNMRFASATDRTNTMVGDLAPFAGAASYLADVGSFTRYNGTAWVSPPPLSMFAFAQAAGTLNLASSTLVSAGGIWATNLLGTYNYSGWFTSANGQFKPQIAGYYEFAASGVNNPSGYTTGMRTIGLRLNGGATLLPASACSYTVAADVINTLNMRPNVQYLNGTTDYVEVAFYHTIGANLNVSYSSSYLSMFTGRYVGA